MKKSKKNLKENPLISGGAKIKKGSFSDSSDNEVRNFIIIVIIIAVLLGLVYLLTEIFEKDKTTTPAITTGEINYDKVSVGTILNRPYDEYYVLVYDSENESAAKYSAVLSQYQNKTDDKKLKIYYCDLGNTLNKSYYNVNNDNKSNKNAKKVSEFDFGDLTLLKIKNGSVSSYIENYDDIKEELK